MPGRLLLSIFLLAGALVLAPLPCVAANSPPELSDQYGRPGGLAEFTGRPVLAIVARPRQLRWIGRWEAAIRAEIPALQSIRVADVTDRPAPDHAKVAGVLRERVPENIGVLIDLDGRWAGFYSLDTDEPCLVLLDPGHQVVATFRGRPKGLLVDDVIAALRPYFPAADEP